MLIPYSVQTYSTYSYIIKGSGLLSFVLMDFGSITKGMEM